MPYKRCAAKNAPSSSTRSSAKYFFSSASSTSSSSARCWADQYGQSAAVIGWSCSPEAFSVALSVTFR